MSLELDDVIDTRCVPHLSRHRANAIRELGNGVGPECTSPGDIGASDVLNALPKKRPLPGKAHPKKGAVADKAVGRLLAAAGCTPRQQVIADKGGELRGARAWRLSLVLSLHQRVCATRSVHSYGG